MQINAFSRIRVGLVLSLLLFPVTPHLQRRTPQTRQEQAEEVLTPLTPEERALNPRDIVASQPDYAADLTFFVSEGFGGFGGAQRQVRQGNRYCDESQFWILVGERGKSTARLSPSTKTYDDFLPSRYDSVNSEPLDPAVLMLDADRTFSSLGTVIVDGHKCLKIESKSKSNPDQKILLFAARDLNNLIIITQVVSPHRSMGQWLKNISLTVPAELVDIPADYKPVEHDRWTKLEAAKVTWKGGVPKGYKVYQSPSQELFIWLDDGVYPWTYLIRPREAIRETAFQGLLVTRKGAYIWETDETEAFSLTNYRVARPPSKYERKDDRVVIVAPGSVKFRAISYEKDKAMIEVSW
jgi:hypothetical protein